MKEIRFFQGVGPVADAELEIHFRLCGGVIVVASPDLLKWSKLLRSESGLYTPYTFRSIRTLPRLTLVGTLPPSQLAHLHQRALKEGAECSVIDVRRNFASFLRS